MEPRAQFAVMAAALICGAVFGRLLIPVLRKHKTGKLEIYIGDRVRQDGSEPSGGGAVLLPAAAVALSVGCAVGGADPTAAVWGLIFCALLTALGLGEDLYRDKTGGIGMKSLYRFLIKLILGAGLTVLMGLRGFECRRILLPFRMGYMELGRAYVPLTALLFAVTVTALEQHDCHKGIHDTGIDGLCLTTSMVGLLGLTACFSSAVPSADSSAWAAAGAGACAGMLFWCLTPGKLFLGSSGAMCIGGIFCVLTLTGGLHGAVLAALAAPVIDGACALIQRAVFRSSKKLVFKGASLREHLRNTGWTDLAIIVLFSLMAAAGAVLAVIYGVYYSRLAV